MPRLSLHSALGTAILLISPLAMALGFGPTATRTTLGQHLDFSASVMLDADETVARDCVTAEVLAGDNAVAPRNVRAVLEATGDPARRVVRVTTSIAIDEPVVTVEISIGCGSRITRRFVAFIDPPSLRLAEAEPSETVPLPNQYIDSQTVSLADIARQADASRRRGSSEVRAGDADRPSRNVRRADRAARADRADRADRAPAAVIVASATSTAQSRPRRQAAAPKPASRTRTALASAPRVAGARLRLDPPRAVALAALPSPAAAIAPPAAIALAAPRPAAAAGPAPAPAAAPVVLALAAPNPLMAQLAAAAAAATGASMPAASAEQERMQSLEAAVARMSSESQATHQTVAALQARVRQAEDSRYRNPLVYVLAGTTLLAILAAALLWWLRPRQRRRARWFDAQANQQARAAARGGPSTSAGLASQPTPLSRPVALSPPLDRPAARPAPPRLEPSSGWNTGPTSLMQTTQHASIGGLEVTTVLGPETSRTSFEPFAGGASARQGGELTMEELIDLEQQAEFFVVLGQDEAAMSLLEGYTDHGGMSPLPHLQLLEIHQRRADRAAYDRVRRSFNERFDANAPDWSFDLHRGRTLDDYPQTVALLQSLWPTPLSAMQALDNLLFRRRDDEDTFDFPAYRELLFLYSIARETSGNVETDSGSIDLFLPLEDAPVEARPSQHASLEVDLDVSQWPEDASMSDLLSRPRPSGRRGTA